MHLAIAHDATAHVQRAAWRAPLGAALLWAGVLGLLLSTQFFAQAFVWRHWPVDEVLIGWLPVLRHHLVVAGCIAVVVVAAGRLPIQGTIARAVLLGAALTAGALAGALVDYLLDDFAEPIDTIAGEAVRAMLMALAASAMFYLWLSASEARELIQREELQRVRHERELAQARLTALRSQIEPHFLFNSLATVRRLQRVAPEAGRAVLGHFIDYVQRMLPVLDQREVPLGTELELVRTYLEVVAVRMSGRLQWTIDVPEALHRALLPPLAVATLVENAIKHGLAPTPDAGTLSVRAHALGGLIELEVEDNGAGLGGASEVAVGPGGAWVGAASRRAAHVGGAGVGLSNLRARLDTLYGIAASFDLRGRQPRGTRARMRWPLHHATPGEIR